MKYNQLGRTGLFVSEICLGAMTFGGGVDGGFWKAIGALDQPEVDAIVGRALAAGVNFIDTADVYHFGQSERLVGQALKNLGAARKDVVVATKFLGEMSSGPNDRGASRGHIMDSVQGSLERLQLDHIDLYQIHGNDTVTPIDETLRALDDLTRQGLVRYIGVSNWAAWRIARRWAAANCMAMRGSKPCRPILDRRAGPGTRAGSNDGRGGAWPDGLVAAGRRPSVGQVRPGIRPRPTTRDAPTSDFPPVDKDRAWACIAAMREVGETHGVSVARVGAGLAARQAAGDERDHRGQDGRAARRQSRGRKPDPER